VRRTVDHALFDEPVTHRSDALDLDLEALRDLARPLRRIAQVCKRAKVVFFARRQPIESNSEEIRIQSPYRFSRRVVLLIAADSRPRAPPAVAVVKSDASPRWFTPTTEVPICGHVTLGAAHVLWNNVHWVESMSIAFQTASGPLVALRNDRGIELRLPDNVCQPITPPDW
jgi:hypothetical protein